MKRPLLSLALLFLVGLIVLVIVFLVVSRDIALPDTADLTLEHSEIPAEQNAYTHFLAATKYLYWPGGFSKDADYLAGKPTDAVLIEEMITRNTTTLEAIQQGLACPRCLPPEITHYDQSVPYLIPWTRITRIMAMKVRCERMAGQGAEATRTCIALLDFGNTIQRDAVGMVDYLVALTALDQGLTQARDWQALSLRAGQGHCLFRRQRSGGFLRLDETSRRC